MPVTREGTARRQAGRVSAVSGRACSSNTGRLARKSTPLRAVRRGAPTRRVCSGGYVGDEGEEPRRRE